MAMPMAMGSRILGLTLAVTLGGCGLVYRYGDYRDAPATGGTGGATTTSTGGAGGCTPPADVPGDCQKPTCAGGVPGTEPDDNDVPASGDACIVTTCSGGVPTSDHAKDGIACDGGVCGSGQCVECIGPEQCGGRCCEVGNTCSTSAPTCPDACLDGDETDVDCGGSCAFKCDDTRSCKQGSDCKSGFCDDTKRCAQCTSLVDCYPLCCNGGTCGACP
jgi:hypothetical protein